MANKSTFCPGCFKKNVEVYCNQCAVKVCSFSHLCSHHNHNFEILNELRDDIKTSSPEELHKFEENDECLKDDLDDKSKVTQNLETPKKSVLDKIDTVEQYLHNEEHESSLELKVFVEHNVKDSVDDIFENIIQDIHEEFKCDIKPIIEKVEPSKMIIRVSKFEVDVKSEGDESMDTCISAIQNVENFNVTPTNLPEMLEDNIETSNSNTDGFINLQPTNLNNNRVIKEEIQTSDVNMYAESYSLEYEPVADCSCCNQLEKVSKLIQCYDCMRYFHHECHIPTVDKSMIIHKFSETKWKCTLCKDLREYAKVLDTKDMNGVISVGGPEIVIMERILMEIYCQHYDSKHFRELPDENVYPAYYQKVSSPLSLNDVKEKLESNVSYTSLIQFLLDIKKVFFNGLSYYPPRDPYFTSAANLYFFFKRLINKWIPKLEYDSRLV